MGLCDPFTGMPTETQMEWGPRQRPPVENSVVFVLQGTWGGSRWGDQEGLVQEAGPPWAWKCGGQPPKGAEERV